MRTTLVLLENLPPLLLLARTDQSSLWYLPQPLGRCMGVCVPTCIGTQEVQCVGTTRTLMGQGHLQGTCYGGGLGNQWDLPRGSQPSRQGEVEPPVALRGPRGGGCVC